jgi:hypothetical protein
MCVFEINGMIRDAICQLNNVGTSRINGAKMFNKKTLFVVLLVITISAVSITAYAGPPEDVSGDWYYLPAEPPTPYKVAGGNTFMHIIDTGYFTGDIAGDEADTGEVIIQRNGLWLYWGEANIDEATVRGKTGGLTLTVFGSRPDMFTDWEGTWRITNATGDLAGLKGQGSWEGPGWQGDPDVHGVVHYEGKVLCE